MKSSLQARNFLLFLALLLPLPLYSQSSPPASAPGRLVLILPFDNASKQPSLDWISEAVPEIMNRRFEAASFLPISREDRLYALDHLGLPVDFRPSRASTIRLAQTLDAEDVVIGTYAATGGQLTLTARILDIPSLKLSGSIQQQGDLNHLIENINGLAWQLVRQLDPGYPVAEQTFLAADSNLRLDAFENYIRGLVETKPEERIRHLKQAVRIAPGYGAAWLALGKVYFNSQQYEDAASALGHVPRNSPQDLEASFDRGLSLFYTGNYSAAQEAFAFVATRLPLPDVVNNEGVAVARRNQDAAPLFEQAVASDSHDADYHFNLALAFRRRNDLAGARREIAEALKLRPNDSEAQALSTALQAGVARSSMNEASNEPLERIKRSYDEASFRQAAFEIEQMQAMKLATMAPKQRAEALTAEGNRYLNRGFILEAEREFQTALQTDSGNAAAHAGLAQVRERSGDPDGARQQAQQSLQLQPNVPAHLVLARLDLQGNQLAPAADQVAQALKLEPKNSAAQGMRQALEARGQQVP